MSDVFESTEKIMDDGLLAYGYHRVKIVDDAFPDGMDAFGVKFLDLFTQGWKCMDCFKVWRLRPNGLDEIRNDRECVSSKILL